MNTQTSKDAPHGRPVKVEIDSIFTDIFIYEIICDRCRRKLPCTAEIITVEGKTILHSKECQCVEVALRKLRIQTKFRIPQSIVITPTFKH
jgi:hypothetical protein